MDGQAKYTNKSTGWLLHALLFGKNSNIWASKLLFVEFGINATMSVSTGKSSYELIFGV